MPWFTKLILYLIWYWTTDYILMCNRNTTFPVLSHTNFFPTFYRLYWQKNATSCWILILLDWNPLRKELSSVETTSLKIAMSMWNFFLFFSMSWFPSCAVYRKTEPNKQRKTKQEAEEFSRVWQFSSWMQRTISYCLASLAGPFRTSVDSSDFHWYWQIYGAIIKKEQSGLDQCFQWMRYIVAFHQYQTCITTFPACSFFFFFFLWKDINCGQGKAWSFLEAPCYSFSME